MLQIGLTGGIGSGKSTVARRLVERGAVLIDADAIARAVVEPGTDGLTEIVAAFGDGILAPDGTLDRPALASVVFADPQARDRLNAIVHPRVRDRSAELLAAAAPDAVVVQDIPLLVEGGMAPSFPLVVVVDADPEVRVRRLCEQRGMTEADARARIAAQTDDATRRAAADVVLDNSGTLAEVTAAVDRLWDDRIVGFAANVRSGRPAGNRPPRLVEPDPEWPAAAARLAARISRAAGPLGRGVAHIGSTAVPGMPAKDVIDLQLGVASPADADDLCASLAVAGFPACPGRAYDDPHPTGLPWPKSLHRSADPGRPAHLHIREVGSPGWRYALLMRDWLRADPAAAAEYRAVKQAAAAAHRDDSDAVGYLEQKTPWFAAALPRAEQWAASSGWAASLS